MYGKDNQMYDLHGLSEDQAAMLVGRVIRETGASATVRLRFVTGRGNHVNSKGLRGTLFNAFPEWLKSSPYADRIEKIDTYDGHYEVFIKPTLLDNRFNQHLKEFGNKFFGEHIDEIRVAAEQGDLESMVLYGQFLETGEHVEQDVKAASQYIKCAAEAGLPMAMHEYARYWLHGIGVRQNDDKARLWLWKAHQAGFRPSTLTLAKSYTNGLPGYPVDLETANRLHKIAADAGYTDSMRYFASQYFAGNGVAQSYVRSFEWYKRAADLGDAKAQFNIAVMYRDGRGTPQSHEESKRYFKLAAYGGDVDAQYIHAIDCLRKGGEKNKEQCIMWLFTAADNGSEQANEHLSRLLPADEAREYLARSAHAGNFISQMKLNLLDGKPADSGINLNKILAMYRVLTDNDIKLMSVSAKYFMLDKILLEGPAKEKRSAFSVIEDMAEHDCTFALRRVAYFYQRGDGVLKLKKTPAKVLEIISRSSECGDAIDMVRYGLICLEKSITPQSIEIAKKLFRQAAEKKYPPGFYWLGKMYADNHFGEGKHKQAMQCLRSALKYECLAGHIQKFIMGPMDEYQPVSQQAQVLVETIEHKMRHLGGQVREPQKSTGISAGFFNATPHAREARSTAPIPDLRRERVECARPATQSPDLEPASDNSSSWSFFSTKVLVLSAAVATVCMFGLK